jgi:hypothetical protein
LECSNELLPPETTYGPKFVDVHTLSEKLKDVTGKTNIRQFCRNPTVCYVLLFVYFVVRMLVFIIVLSLVFVFADKNIILFV